MTCFVDGPIQILPLAFDADIGFIQAPACAHGSLALPKGLVQGGRELQHPAIETGLIPKTSVSDVQFVCESGRLRFSID